ncbi:transient receptor potential cation channel subfamily a member 1-like [Gigaspora margarita]|uniref:Transient receptor potential cation channel subfamily a member 1-like n=1 Tax=Gigaspora margarita TaxID=4874 RepID=A0A8H4AWV4_GIGMA|nr:transient receptor potential cation channel subfamily a member 1-like [Gigaspora margarita]
MSTSGEVRLDIDEDNSHRQNQSSNAPHGGKKIHEFAFSPDMKYFVTWSDENKSIFGWTITEEHEELKLEFDNSISSEELKNIVLKSDKQKYKETIYSLIGVSNCKQIILKIHREDPYDFEIIDITTKLRQELKAQGLKGWTSSITFLEDGDLAIAKHYPVCGAYIFSKFNGKSQWTCKKIVKLKNFESSFIFKNGKLLLLFKLPFVIMQWDLKTLKLETQYILNWNLYPYDLTLEMNSDKKLLAVAGRALDWDWETSIAGPAFNGETSIHVYSTESGAVVAHSSFEESLHNFCFIGTAEEQLFFSGSKLFEYNSYILNPHTLKPQDTKYFLHIYSPTSENYHEYQYHIISDFIINLDINDLSIKRLSHNENWKIHLQNQERYVSNTFFNIKEIKQFVQDTLEKCKSDQILIQSYSNRPKEIPYGESYTWKINTTPHSYLKNYQQITVEAIIGEESNIFAEISASTDNEDSYILEYKLLENGDIILAYSEGVQIFTVNSQTKELSKIYFWSDGYKNEKETAQQSTKRQLTSFVKKITKSKLKILPPPTYDSPKYDYDWQNDYVNNELALKLYGNAILNQLAQFEYEAGFQNRIEELFTEWLNHSISAYKSGDAFDFVLFTSQIASALIKLEECHKNLKVTERYLSKINLLVPGIYGTNKYPILSHFHHCGIYDHTSLSMISSFDYLLFWISEKWNLLKKKYPKICKILASPYIFYSNYSTNYSQKTVTLLIPLLNFATYPEEYSYFELLYLPDNSFTSLDAPDYYKWWNIKALINFKWNTYGKRYYFIIWTTYLIFMCCFLTVSTITENAMSWHYQAILLISTIFCGFIHLIFEARQYIHKPMSYIASPWNWFDLAAILAPTITSFIWLHDEKPQIWIVTIASFLLEIKFLLFFRALEYFGKYFAIMIGVARQIFSFLVVLGILVLAFAHSLHLLLRPTSEYSYDQPSNTDDANNPWNLVPTYKFVSSNGAIGESSLIKTPDDNTNLFTMFSTSILAVYFMLTGIMQ